VEKPSRPATHPSRQLAAAIAPIAAVLIDLALRGNTTAITLAFRLHEAYEQGRWEIIDRALDGAAAADDDEQRIQLSALAAALLAPPDSPVTSA
jgi:hypothetical protein